MSAVRLPSEPTTNLFVPDIVRQSQFLSERASPHRFSGEYRLALAILEDAIQAFCMDGSGRRNLRLRQEAGRWLSSDDRSWCFSFERICEVLDLDPDSVRRGLHAPGRRAATMLPFPERGMRDERRGRAEGETRRRAARCSRPAAAEPTEEHEPGGGREAAQRSR
jgi:hypothetical protein